MIAGPDPLRRALRNRVVSPSRFEVARDVKTRGETAAPLSARDSKSADLCQYDSPTGCGYAGEDRFVEHRASPDRE